MASALTGLSHPRRTFSRPDEREQTAEIASGLLATFERGLFGSKRHLGHLRERKRLKTLRRVDPPRGACLPRNLSRDTYAGTVVVLGRSLNGWPCVIPQTSQLGHGHIRQHLIHTTVLKALSRPKRLVVSDIYQFHYAYIFNEVRARYLTISG